MSHLDNAFKILKIATDLEEEARTKAQKSTYIESAKKYLEACDLFNKHIQTNAKNQKRKEYDNATKAKTTLILKKMTHYQNHANSLLDLAREGLTKEKKDEIPKAISLLSSDIDLLDEAANTQLSSALDLDEQGQKKLAISEYIKAADLLLKCCKQVQNQSVSEEKNNANMEKIAMLKSRLNGTLGSFHCLQLCK